MEVYPGVARSVWLSSALGLFHSPRECPLVAVSPKPHRETDLLKVIHTGNPLRLTFGPTEDWQQQSGENRDDRDDHQQFNEREGAPYRTE